MYHSSTTLGEKYTDNATGFIGTATALVFPHQGEIRVELSALVNGKIVTEWFSEDRLMEVDQEIEEGPEEE